MKNKYKPSLIEQRSFPFTCSDSYGVEASSRALHWHKEMEICYIKQGTGKYLINGREYSFETGDLFLINNDEIHLCYEDQNLVMLVLMFDPSFLWSGGSNTMDYEYLRPFWETEQSYGNWYSRIDQTSPRMVQLLQDIQLEYETQTKACDLMIKSLLLELMTRIIRCHILVPAPYAVESSEIRSGISLKAVTQMKLVFAYLEEHFTSPISLQDLAQVAGMSIPYLCSVFKSTTGLSPIDYLNRMRLNEAKNALIQTNQSILSVSELCGFTSLSNFNHLFKSYVGMSPRDYRKMNL